MRKKAGFCGLFAMGIVLFIANPSYSRTTFSIAGKPLGVQGFVSQSLQFSLKGDHWDTEQDINAVISNFFVEADYKVNPNWSIYGAAMVTVDWIYQLKSNDSSWNDKLFSKSKSNLNVDDEYWQLLKEARLTWTPQNFMFRVGKQIVSWGELMAFRIMDQINPLDSRRGFLDVEFETTIIPIWLIRADYYPSVTYSWLQDLGFEFVLNPNADFIPNQDIIPTIVDINAIIDVAVCIIIDQCCIVGPVIDIDAIMIAIRVIIY